MNARIASVIPASPADRAGLESGDDIVSVNGKLVLDILDFRFETAHEQVTVECMREGRSFVSTIEKDAYEHLGIEFEEDLFDGLRLCQNSCIFCFLQQMPKGLRPTLYVRDDDFRLSFTQGNYLTLTNLTGEDMDRICSQKMSPLYVSVHATDPELRARMLGNPKAELIMEQLRRLAASRIRFHTQIVLCPGVNDGAHLERTVDDLAGLFPATESIAIVPVGLTKHRKSLRRLRTADAQVAREVMALCLRKQQEFRARYGTRLVFASDELHLISKRGIPSSSAYEGFPQLEDGIGVTRIFLDELSRLRRMKTPSPRRGSYVLVTGTLAKPLLEQFAEWMSSHPGVRARVCEVSNGLLGETVTVAGLMVGADVIRALGDVQSGEEILIPSVALNERRFLDEVTLDDVRVALRARVTAVKPSPVAAWEQINA